MSPQISLNGLIQQVTNGLQNTQEIPVQLHGQSHQGDMKGIGIRMVAEYGVEKIIFTKTALDEIITYPLKCGVKLYIIKALQFTEANELKFLIKNQTFICCSKSIFEKKRP